MTNKAIELNPDADYTAMQPLAQELLERINDYRKEQRNFNENDFDGMYDYLGGLVAAYQSVAGMIGVPMELYYVDED